MKFGDQGLFILLYILFRPAGILLVLLTESTGCDLPEDAEQKQLSLGQGTAHHYFEEVFQTMQLCGIQRQGGPFVQGQA